MCSHIAVTDCIDSGADITEVKNYNDCETTSSNASHTIEILPRVYVIEECTDDTSTVLSDSIFDNCTDHRDFEKQLAIKSSVIPFENIGQSIRGSNENPGKISIENSSDVLFGSKTFFTGPVVIKQFIAESDAANVNPKEEYSDELDTATIITKISGKKILSQCYEIFRQRTAICIVTIAVVIFLLSAIIAGVYYLNLPTPNNFPTEQSTENPDENTTTNSIENYDYINRSEINLLPPENPLVPLQLPVKRVIIAHTATPICKDFAECSARILNIQSYHMKSLEFDDIGLNFLVGGDGRAYEGRGYFVGAHTIGYNSDSICISFIGHFATDVAPQRQILAAQRLIDDGIKDNKIDSQYVLYGQIQLNGNKSPGTNVYNIIKTWDHWSDRV